jgi:hypothetical protein
MLEIRNNGKIVKSQEKWKTEYHAMETNPSKNSAMLLEDNSLFWNEFMIFFLGSPILIRISKQELYVEY